MLIRAGAGAFDETAPIENTVDERRLMAYAAGVRDTSPALFDLDCPGGIVAHPVFPVCLEWPLLQHGAPGLDFPDGGSEAGLHLTHEIVLHRPIRAGERLLTRGRLLALEQRSRGIFAVCELSTVTPAGEAVVDTREGILYLEATLEGELGAADQGSSTAPTEVPTEEIGSVEVTLSDAVIYSECSGIYNPLHTDIRLTRAIGLPDGPLLHGTATLAMSVSQVVRELADGDPARVARLGGRFSAPVPMPSTLAIQAGRRAETVRFAATTPTGGAALSHAFLELRA